MVNKNPRKTKTQLGLVLSVFLCFLGMPRLMKTRFGPNRVAADTEGNGEFDFWVIFEDFWRHS